MSPWNLTWKAACFPGQAQRGYLGGKSRWACKHSKMNRLPKAEAEIAEGFPLPPPPTHTSCRPLPNPSAPARHPSPLFHLLSFSSLFFFLSLWLSCQSLSCWSFSQGAGRHRGAVFPKDFSSLGSHKNMRSLLHPKAMQSRCLDRRRPWIPTHIIIRVFWDVLNLLQIVVLILVSKSDFISFSFGLQVALLAH